MLMFADLWGYQGTNVDSGSDEEYDGPLDGQDSLRELQARANGSKLVPVDGAGHEIYVDRAKECQKALLEFLGALR